MKSKSSIVLSGIFARFKIVLGVLIAVIGLFTGIAGFEIDDTATSITAFILCVLFMAAGIALVINGSRTIKRISRFRQYVSLISNMHFDSISEISSQMSQQADFTLKDLEFMIRKQYFTNAYIDQATGKIIVYHAAAQGNPATRANPNTASPQGNAPAAAVPPEPVKCSGCGAVNTILPGQSMNCEYCGAPLK